MKVILLKDVRGCGQANTIVDVADGYAANFLFPHKYATAATEDKVKEIESRKAQLDAERQKAEEDLIRKIQSLEGKKITVTVRATEKGGLFKALHAEDIVKSIRLEHNLEIPIDAVIVDPIKTVGEHKVRLASKSAKAELSVAVTAQ